MKILFVSHYVELYGANRSLLNLISGLSKRGIDSWVLCPKEGPISQRIREVGGNVLVDSVKWWAIPEEEINRYNFFGRCYLLKDIVISLFNADVRILDKVREIDPDVIYTNSSVCITGYALSRKLNKPHVWHLREYGYEDYGLKFVLGKYLSARIIASSECVITISQSVRTYFFRRSVFNKNVFVIYNGVITESKALEIQAPEIQFGGPFRLLMVGLIHPQKGCEGVINAVAELRNMGVSISLTIVGGGCPEEVQRIRNLIAKKKVEKDVLLVGYVEDPFPFYSHHDALVMASEQEAMGRVTAEAMIVGLPVLGRDGGGTREIIDDGETGYLFREADGGLVNAIKNVINDLPRWKIMGDRAKKVAEKRFTEEVYVESVFNLLKEFAK